jgi:outer membrane protein
MAQKFAYVHSQQILAEYQEYVDVQNKLEEIRNKYDSEYQQMVNEYNVMIEEIDSQSLLLSPEKKEEKMKNAQDKALAIEKYKYEKLGPEGEYYKKNLELTKPIIDKINNLIQKIGEEDGYDFIFDASSGALVHANTDKYDITQRVLEELNKGVSTSTSGN